MQSASVESLPHVLDLSYPQVWRLERSVSRGSLKLFFLTAPKCFAERWNGARQAAA